MIMIAIMMTVYRYHLSGLWSRGCESGAGLENWKLDTRTAFQVQTFNALFQAFQVQIVDAVIWQASKVQILKLYFKLFSSKNLML